MFYFAMQRVLRLSEEAQRLVAPKAFWADADADLAVRFAFLREAHALDQNIICI
jgi:hypothetical protein